MVRLSSSQHQKCPVFASDAISCTVSVVRCFVVCVCYRLKQSEMNGFMFFKPKSDPTISFQNPNPQTDSFKGILNSENSDSESAEFVEHSINYKNYLGPEMAMCSVVSLTSLLQKLPLNKPPRPDVISAEHLLYTSESLCFFLTVLSHICIVHSFVRSSCLNTTIVPICKNKNGNITHTSKYRPVAVATVVSKLLEQLVLASLLSLELQTINLILRLDMVLTNFKAGHSTDQF